MIRRITFLFWLFLEGVYFWFVPEMHFYGNAMAAMLLVSIFMALSPIMFFIKKV